MEASGVGKALEDFKADYAKGAKALWEAGPAIWNQALKKAVVVTKSLGVAKGKANSIKVPDKKKLALEVVAGFETAVAKFTNEILTLVDNQKKAEAARKQMIASLTFKQMIGNAEMLRAFRAHCAKEHSTDEGEAAIGWELKKYKEVTLKYGPNNAWNQQDETTRKLLAHYKGTTVLPSSDLGFEIGKVSTGLHEMVTGGNSLFSRFKAKMSA